MRSSLYDPRQGKRAPTEEGPRWFVGYAEPLRPIVAALPSLFPKLRMILRIVGIDPAILAPVTWLDFVLAKELVNRGVRSEEHTSELQSLMRISYAVFCLKKKK